MGYRIVSVMADFFFQEVMRERDSEFKELLRIEDGLPSDAKFIEYRINPKTDYELQLVFESDEWDEENNFKTIDVTYESITYQEENLDKIIMAAISDEAESREQD